MEKRTTTLLFDLGGVILNLDYQRTIRAFELLGKGEFRTAYSQSAQSYLFDQFEIGKIEEQEFRNGMRALLGCEVSDSAIDDAWNAMLLDLPIERVAYLMELRARYRLYLFSNTNSIHLRQFQKIIENQYGNGQLLESIFDKTYYSHLIGLRKPTMAAFQFILEDQNLLANEVIFIDDSLQHIQGAASLGINAYHLENSDLISFCKTILT